MILATPVAVRLRRLVRSLMTVMWLLAVVGPLLMLGQFVVSNRISTVYSPAIDDSRAAVMVMRWAQSDLRLYHESRNPEIVADFADRRDEARRLIGELQSTVGGASELAPLVDRASRAADEWWDAAAEIERRTGDGAPSDITAPMASFGEFTAATSELTDRLSDERDDMRAIRDGIFGTGVVLALAAAAAATVYGRRQERRAANAIVTPIQMLDQVVIRQRGGDEGARAETDLGPVEVRNLATELNSLLDQTRDFKKEQVYLTTAQAVVLKAAQQLREAPTMADAARLITEIVTEGLECDACLLRFRSAGGEEMAYHWADPRGRLAGLDATGAAAYLPDSLPELAPRRTLAIADCASAIEPTSPELRELARERDDGPGALLVVPIRLGKDRFGSLSVVKVEGPRRWRSTDTAMLEQIAGVFARTLFERIAHDAQREHVRQLQSLDRKKDAFISTVSHELRTPLTSIAGYAEMLGDGDAGDLTAPQRRIIDVIDRNTRRLQGLIEDILILSRVESSETPSANEEVDLSSVAEIVAENLAPSAARKSIALSVNAPQPAEVEGDPSHLERALTNLVGNALKFTPDGGSVTVTVAASADQRVVSVTDSGIGIPVDQQAELFDRFFRASNAESASIPGTGLGLSIVRAIAESHDGEVSFTSREGEGTTFRLTLPARRRG